MKKPLSIAALLAVGAIAAQSIEVLATKKQANKHVLKLVNVKLVREDLEDGGLAWNGRACGYDQVDGGTVSEPCWQVRVPGPLFAPVGASVLDQKK